MKTVWTQEADARLRDYLASHELVAGIGTEKSTCSVAAINLALTEKVMDTIPKCMSKVIGQWMMAVQDVMPWEMRNSPGWKCLLPMAAGTGREREEERLALVMDWMWGTVLPDLQSVADQGGFGAGWRIMCTERSLDAAAAAAGAAGASRVAWSALSVARAASRAAGATATATAAAWHGGSTEPAAAAWAAAVVARCSSRLRKNGFYRGMARSEAVVGSCCAPGGGARVLEQGLWSALPPPAASFGACRAQCALGRSRDLDG